MSRIRSTTMVVLLALAAAACGGGDDDGSATDDGAATATATPTATDTRSGSEPATETAATEPPVEAGGEASTMVWAIQSPPGSMDPAKAGDVPTLRVQTAVFDRLLRTGNDGSVEPWIATAWDNPDPLTWTFTIRDDVTFWDGSPMTAEDVAFSWSRHVGPESTSFIAYNFFTVDSVMAIDESTITVQLNTPDPAIPAKAAISVPIMSQAYVEAAGDELGGPDQPGMGTGPYVITSYSSAEGATLTRNEQYWAGVPKIETLEFVVISDPDTARLALDSGEIDGYFDVPLIATSQWDELSNATMSYVTGGYNDMLAMDVTRPPFDDVNARRALAHLIDREGLTGPLFNGRATTASTVVPATQLASALGQAGADDLYAGLPPVPEFSVDAAREALAASTTPDGFSVELRVDETQPWMSPLGQSLAQNAAEIGITIEVISVSSGDWIADLTDPEGSPLQLLALGAGTPWPGELPPVIVGTDAGFNPSKYGGGEIDDLVGQIASAGDLDTLMAPLTDLLTRMGNDLPYVPLFDEQSAVAISNDFVWEGDYSYWSLGQPWPMQLGGAG